MTTNRRINTTTCLLVSMLPMACAAPCLDDGLLQATCPSPAALDTAGTSDDASGDDAMNTGHGPGDGDGDGDGGGSGTSTGADGDGLDGTAGLIPTTSDGDDGNDGNEDSEGDDEEPWCLDADGDGFGDPSQCSDEPGPGTVNNDDDCNDADADTFPGAAEHEPDPMACATDADGDGWGDATPAHGAVAGADCWDDEPTLNPALVRIGTVDNGPLDDVAAAVDLGDATLSVIAPIDTPLLGWNSTAAALRHDGQVIAIEEVSGRLQRIEYQEVCDGTSDAGVATPIGPDLSNLSLCGLSFDANDRLWGIDAQTDAVLEFDPDSGAPLSSTPLTLGGAPLALGDCDLTWDCHEERLLLADATMGHVLSLEPVLGHLSLVAVYDPDLGAAGIGYEPVERVAYVSSGIQLNRVPLDGTDATEIGIFHYEGAMVADVANLVSLRICE